MPADLLPSLFGCSLIPPNGNNVPRYCNRRLQPLLDRIEHTYDEIAAKPMYQQVLRTFDKDVPFIVICLRNEYYIHTEAVTGLRYRRMRRSTTS